MNTRRAACLFLILAILGLAGTILYQGHVLTRSANRPVSLADSSGFVRVEFSDTPGRTTRGFFFDVPGEKAFILAHGNSSDGSTMLARARWLASQGFSVLIPDLQAHGETPGTRKTFGWREAEDLMAAYRYLKTHRGKAWVGGIGCSLGGASLLKAGANGIRFDMLAKPWESEMIFANLKAKKKRILKLEGAGHVDLFAYDQARYSEVLLKFLQGSRSASQL